MADSRQSEIARLELLFAAHPEGRVFTHLAEAYRRAGELERARTLLEAGLERHADYASAHVVHGRVLLDLGLEAEAEAAFRRVLGLDPENLVALRVLGDLARRAGRAAEALGYYEQLQLRDPSSEELDAVIGELRAMVAPPPVEAGDGTPAAAAADAGTADGAEPGFEGAAAVAEATADGAEEPAGSAAEEQAGLEPQETAASEAKQPVAAEAQEWAVEGRADEEADAPLVEPAGFSAEPEPPVADGATHPAEAEALGESEAGPADAEGLVAGGAAMGEAEASGADEAGPEEPAAVFESALPEAEPALPEAAAAEALADPAAIVTWPVPESADAGVPSLEGGAAEPDATGGEGVEAEAAEPAVEEAVMSLDGLADVATSDAVLTAEPADAPPEIALDEEVDLEIGSLADIPDATHSLLFKDEYMDPESEALPLDAWTPLTDDQIAEMGAAAGGDAGPGDLEASSGVVEVGSGDLEAGPADLEAGHEGPEAAGPAAVDAAVEAGDALSGAESDVVVSAVEETAPEPAVEPADAGGEGAGAAVATQAEWPEGEQVAPGGEPIAAVSDAAPLVSEAVAPETEAVPAAPEAEALAPEVEAFALASEAVAPASEAGAPASEVVAPPAPAEPRGETVEGPESLGGEVVTETLADLYLSQGLFDRAAALYRRLLENQPGDARLEARLREAEEQLAGTARAEGGGPGWEVVGLAGDGAEQRVEDVEAVWTGGAGAGGQDVSPYVWPDEGEPGPGAEADEGPTIGQYLDALLQWKPSRAEAPAEVAPPAEPKAEAGGGDGAAVGKRDSDSDDDDDLEMFRAWLQSLKR